MQILGSHDKFLLLDTGDGMGRIADIKNRSVSKEQPLLAVFTLRKWDRTMDGTPDVNEIMKYSGWA